MRPTPSASSATAPRPAPPPSIRPRPAENDETNPNHSWYSDFASTIVHTETTIGHAQSALVRATCAAYHHAGHPPVAPHRPPPSTVAPPPPRPEPADTTPPATPSVGPTSGAARSRLVAASSAVGCSTASVRPEKSSGRRAGPRGRPRVSGRPALVHVPHGDGVAATENATESTTTWVIGALSGWISAHA